MDTAFGVLRQFVRPRAPAERCDLCAGEVPEEHEHLLELAERRLHCACGPCAILFGGGGRKYRRVPRRVRKLPDLRLSDAQWDDLRLPIDLAFFFHSTPMNRIVAAYPGPAGATESLLELEAWDALVAENPVLAELEPDVEALLVNRLTRGSRRDRPESPARHYLVPIDQCYRLVGVIRTQWRGLGGGNEVWTSIDECFADLDRRAGQEERLHA